MFASNQAFSGNNQQSNSARMGGGIFSSNSNNVFNNGENSNIFNEGKNVFGVSNPQGQNYSNHINIRNGPVGLFQSLVNSQMANLVFSKTPTNIDNSQQTVYKLTNQEASYINLVFSTNQIYPTRSKNAKLDEKHLVKCISNQAQINKVLTKEEIRIIWIKTRKLLENKKRKTELYTSEIISPKTSNSVPLSNSAIFGRESSNFQPQQFKTNNNLQGYQVQQTTTHQPFIKDKKGPFGSFEKQAKKAGVNFSLSGSNNNPPCNNYQDQHLSNFGKGEFRITLPQNSLKGKYLNNDQNTADNTPLSYHNNFTPQILKPTSQNPSFANSNPYTPAIQSQRKRQQFTSSKRDDINRPSDPFNYQQLSKSLQNFDPKLQIILPQFLFLLQNTQQMAHQITNLLTQSNTSKSNKKQRRQINSFSLPLIGQFSIAPSQQIIERMKQVELKNVKGVRIWNQYGEVYFLEAISLIELDLEQCLIISQDNIQILNDDLQNKKARMTFRNFGKFTNLKDEQQRGAMLRRIRRWMAKYKMRQVSHDKWTGDLVVEIN